MTLVRACAIIKCIDTEGVEEMMLRDVLIDKAIQPDDVGSAIVAMFGTECKCEVIHIEYYDHVFVQSRNSNVWLEDN